MDQPTDWFIGELDFKCIYKMSTNKVGNKISGAYLQTLENKLTNLWKKCFLKVFSSTIGSVTSL